MSLRGIFDDNDTIRKNGLEMLDVYDVPKHVNGNHRLGRRPHLLDDSIRIDQPGSGIYIREDGSCPHFQDRTDRWDGSKWGRDDLVARPDAQ